MAVYTGLNKNTYDLTQQVGSGGEGIVYDIKGCPDKVAKIYKPEKFKTSADRSTQERKLAAMLKMNVSAYVDGILRLAWPLDILYEHGQMVGFVMPKLSETLKIFELQRFWRASSSNPNTQKILKKYPNFTWKYQIQFAYNLSWVVQYVHSLGIVIGDLNLNNIHADTKTGAIVLIDCDSFDITDPQTRERFPCDVGFPELLAPELQMCGALRGKHTRETDYFSLAIHIFRLLMRNADPFSGVGTSGASSSTVSNANANIVNGNCPYVRSCGVTVPKWAPDFSILPLTLQNLFKKTFDYTATTARSKIGKRATAAEWCNALLPLGNGKVKMTTCTKNKYHVYDSHNASCPWCKLEGSSTAPKKTASQPAGTAGNPGTKNKGSVVRRSPALLYIVLIAFGISGGFLFNTIGSELAWDMFELEISPFACNMILSIIGAFTGMVIGAVVEDEYVRSTNALPWFLLAFLTFVLPPIICILAGFAISLVGIILGMIAGLLMAGVLLFIVCACLSSC